MLQALDAEAVSRWADACVADLEANREEIDRINVYPIADADTGSNLLYTMRAALDSLRHAPAEVSSAVSGAISALAKGALTGARGNSGVILSQVLRGLAEAVQGASVFTGGALRTALSRADELATAAVARPVPGTVLSVLHAAAQAAADTDSDALPSVAAAALAAADDALERTPDQLAVLARAGVVDAGGRGLVVLLEALSSVVGSGRGDAARRLGRPDAESPPVGSSPVVGARGTAGEDAAEAGAQQAGQVAGGSSPSAAAVEIAAEAAGPTDPAAQPSTGRGPQDHTPHGAPDASGLEPGSEQPFAGSPPAYEVMYLLADSDQARADELRLILDDLGDSVSVAGDGAGLWSVHVHCDDIGAAIEAGVERGRPHRIRVVRFADQPAPPDGPTEPHPTVAPVSPHRMRALFGLHRAVVTVAASEGLATLFADEGARVLRPSSRSGAAAVVELVGVIRETGARHVSVLPNGAVSIEVADRAAAEAMSVGQDVVVVPTVSPVQGLAALAVHDPRRRPAEDSVAMAEAAAATRRGEVLVATSAALTWAGRCEPGDVLGLVDDEVMIIGRDPIETASALLDRMLSTGGELVTVLPGGHAPDGLLVALSERLRRIHPEVDLTCFDGDLPDTVLLLGVE
ncbi:DAK2 domain-containing protein [Actinoalloteichus sp. GBA129-24]|uniref:DAK2 domain-containing protein n=1 Tax=Actinoalloteichus sp. GBA129-24 TaxID=1612551 RepID=UPI0009504924|nr:DAK2 domain-containing protein [Actinoalloteichus sp. GBA129-24]APU23229.1 putative kinase, dihydroxyacetone kinase [Actinoalloteichus sp. GBA129-24]